MRATLISLALIIFASACTSSNDLPVPPLPGASTEPTSLAERYAFLFTRNADATERGLQAVPFSRIELTRGPCYGPCPVYRVSIGRSGQVEYEGKANCARKGHHRGRLFFPLDFARIAYLIERTDIPNLKREYAFPATDMDTVTIRIEYVSDAQEPLVFTDYGQVAPIELWALEVALDGLLHTTEWQDDAGAS